MIPEVGRTGIYSDENCVLQVEILEYNPKNSVETFRFKVLKNLKEDSLCGYEKDHQLVRERIRGENGLWSLILD